MNEQRAGETPSNPARVFSIAGWVVDPPIGRISRGDETTQLEPKVMEVLEYLARRPGQVVGREELEAAVWRGRVVGYDAVTNAIIKLRKAFKDDPRHPKIIETLSKRGYRLVAPVGQPEERTETNETAGHDLARVQTRNRWIGAGAATALAVLVAAVGALFWQSPWKAAVDIGGDRAPLKSIAVLPFDNLSGDRDQDYFADGVTDDLITGLAKNPDLLVIARDSAFVYKDQPLDVRQAAERLNVRFVLHGSVRRVGRRVRINAQLIEAASGAHLWAERYDGEMGAVLNMQDKITQSIISALAVTVGGGERQDLGAPLTHSAEAYDHFLRGRQHFYLYLNRAENKKARELFHKAAQADPNFAMAYAMLAWTHAFDAMNGWSDKPEQSLRDANDLAAKAISLQKALPVAYFVAGLAYRERGSTRRRLSRRRRSSGTIPTTPTPTCCWRRFSIIPAARRRGWNAYRRRYNSIRIIPTITHSTWDRRITSCGATTRRSRHSKEALRATLPPSGCTCGWPPPMRSQGPSRKPDGKRRRSIPTIPASPACASRKLSPSRVRRIASTSWTACARRGSYNDSVVLPTARDENCLALRLG